MRLDPRLARDNNAHQRVVWRRHMQEEAPTNGRDESNVEEPEDEPTGSSADQAKEREREMEKSGEENAA
jgi:hypothetical protein